MCRRHSQPGTETLEGLLLGTRHTEVPFPRGAEILGLVEDWSSILGRWNLDISGEQEGWGPERGCGSCCQLLDGC